MRSTETRQSESMPGVSFTVKVLNQLQRAQRDMELSDHRVEVNHLSMKAIRLGGSGAAHALQLLDQIKLSSNGHELTANEAKEAQAFQETKDKLAGVITDLNQPDEASLAAQKAEQITASHLAPAMIRYGLVSIEGFPDVDGESVTDADGVIKHAPDALLAEIMVACDFASGLSEQERKNLSSPGTSDDSEAGQPMKGTDASTSVTSAGSKAGTPIETAGSTSPPK